MNMTDTAALDLLTAEGYDPEHIETYITQLTEVGLEIDDQPDTGLILTADEIDTIRAALTHTDPLDDLMAGDLIDVCERLTNLEAQVADTRGERDAEIRRMLRTGVPYRRLGEITGLSRQALDKIRRA